MSFLAPLGAFVAIFGAMILMASGPLNIGLPVLVFGVILAAIGNSI